MKIVHLTSVPAGTPWMVALAREQKALGHDVAVVIPALDGNIATELARAGIAAYAAPVIDAIYGRSLLARAGSLMRIVRLLRRLRPDVVHSHIFIGVLVSRIASWIADVPIHLAGNVHPFSLESTFMCALEVGTAFCDTKTIASSSYTRALYIEHGVTADQVELIFYAVDQRRHDPALVDRTAMRRRRGRGAGTPVVGEGAYL
jgi:hypothetical protein